jgi:hypothetical protein
LAESEGSRLARVRVAHETHWVMMIDDDDDDLCRVRRAVVQHSAPSGTGAVGFIFQRCDGVCRDPLVRRSFIDEARYILNYAVRRERGGPACTSPHPPARWSALSLASVTTSCPVHGEAFLIVHARGAPNEPASGSRESAPQGRPESRRARHMYPCRFLILPLSESDDLGVERCYCSTSVSCK